MKKTHATALLIIGSLAAFSTIASLVWKISFISDIMAMLGIALLAALGFAASRIYPLFREKYGFTRGKFALACYLPCFLGALLCFAVTAAGGSDMTWAALGVTGMSLVYLVSGTVFGFLEFKKRD
ncbi:MAG: hypothetical protein NC299_03865 [Lachnospiraceae bacterium]|nr:hypothetical protein [Ruminococcus sp.]MCM1274483.1 hypothetical protein [Lachnospiraceae bacterium]